MRKSVLVTGATNGTGYAIARRFAAENYDVFICSRSGEAAAAAAKALMEDFPVQAVGYETKIFDEENVKAIFADIRSRGYLLDVLVLNAANLGIGQVSLEVNIQEFMNVFNTNIGWNFLMAREAAKQMKKNLRMLLRQQISPELKQNFF